MADYLQLHSAKNDSDLQDKVEVAIVVAAETIRTDDVPPPNQVQRLAWAQSAMTNPKANVEPMLWALLAAHKDADIAVILAAPDATIQAAVDAAVDLFAGGL